MIPAGCFLFSSSSSSSSSSPAPDSSAEVLPPLYVEPARCTCDRTPGKRRWSTTRSHWSHSFIPLLSSASTTLPVPQSVSAKSSRAQQSCFAALCQTHKHTRMHRGECCRVSFFFLPFFFSSSRANPEPGPGLPLRCSLAHKHKTAFIILPVAAQGLASKSYWFLSSLSPLHKGRAFCKLLARFRPTKGTFIEPSSPLLPPTALPLSSRHLILLKFDYKAWKRRRRKEKRK